MRISFQQELDGTEATLQQEGELVLRALRGALNALWAQDSELADQGISFDDEIDQAYADIHHGIDVLLRRQPTVASHLRLVVALLHSNLHLERMGDYCVTVAKLMKLVSNV